MNCKKALITVTSSKQGTVSGCEHPSLGVDIMSHSETRINVLKLKILF